MIFDSTRLTAFGDSDISVYYFASGIWNPLENNYGRSYSRTADVNSGNISSTGWAIGGLFPANVYGDSFKIRNIKFERVPDGGGTLILLAMAMGWAEAYRRKVPSN